MTRLWAVLAIMATPAVAQSGQCAPRDILIAHLVTKYGETRQSVGLANGWGFGPWAATQKHCVLFG